METEGRQGRRGTGRGGVRRKFQVDASRSTVEAGIITVKLMLQTVDMHW